MTLDLQENWAGSGFRRTDEQPCYTDGYGDSEIAYGDTPEDGLFFVTNDPDMCLCRCISA